jgi:hypothetical protein
MGKADNVNPPELGQMLANCFAGSQVEWHDGAHLVPSDPEIVAICHRFCLDNSRDS